MPFPVRPRTLVSQIGELPEQVRPEPRLRCRHAKLLPSLPVGFVVVPIVLPRLLAPDPTVLRSAHVLPLEPYFARFESGVVAIVAATADLARVRTTPIKFNGRT